MALFLNKLIRASRGDSNHTMNWGSSRVAKFRGKSQETGLKYFTPKSEEIRLTVGGGEASPSFSQTSNILGASPECME
jgi:hypothetical protein